MPLSDHEQKMLEQMEQALAAEDPKFASQMQGSSLASLQRRRWLVGRDRGRRRSRSRARGGQHDDVGRSASASPSWWPRRSSPPPRRAGRASASSGATAPPRRGVPQGPPRRAAVLHGPARRALGAPPEQHVSPADLAASGRDDARHVERGDDETRRRARSPCCAAPRRVRAWCVARPGARSRLRPVSTRKIPSTNPTTAPTTGTTKKPTMPSTTARASVEERTPCSRIRRPGSMYCRT